MSWQGLLDCDAVFSKDAVRAGWQKGISVVVPDIVRDALEADVDLVEAFSAAYIDGYVTVKRAEWDRYQRWTTGWEMTEYLPFL